MTALLAPLEVTSSPAPRVTVPAADMPDVSVIVVTYGTGRIAADTIASLVESAAGSRTIEVIVVDNPHPTVPDRTLLALRVDTHGVRVLRPDRNLGFGGGSELGALHARGKFLAFVNPDVSFPPGWLDPLVEALETVPPPSIVAPVLADPDGTVQEAGQWLDAHGGTHPLVDVPDEQLVVVDYASAACWVMRRTEHERLGGFDPAYHPAYFEDVDLALRARALGGTCAVHTGVRVVHHRGAGTPERAAPAVAQRDVLVRTWPEIRWTQPS